MIAAVRTVTQGTVFADRCVLKKERTAFFGMTGITRVVYSRTDQKEIIGTIVRIVTIGAGHLTKTKRMATGPESFRTGTWVTCETLFLLSQFIHNGILLRMHVVTTDACNLFFFMYAAKPVNHIAVTVTTTFGSHRAGRCAIFVQGTENLSLP